ncbi:MAG TPA: iduronate-2-sulfatase, partial [Planctomycetaceae bacterium]|nr:iduronate-2-sulfatase [Planctomycetaceae bacterium]
GDSFSSDLLKRQSMKTATNVGSRFAAGALVLWSIVCASAAFAKQPPSRPNVLFIAVDDLRPEIACYGATSITPNMDRLASEGVQFTRAYCNQAVCGASRVSLMTGLYPEFTGERTYHVTGWRDRYPDVITLNQSFKASGYNTVGLGKVYHGSGGPGTDPDNWTTWHKVGGKGYGTPRGQLKFRKSKDRNRGPSTDDADVPDDTYADGNRAILGARLIEELADGDQPFFLAVGFTKPHLPFVAPAKYWNLYEQDAFSMPSNLGVPQGYPDYASNKNAGELRSYSDIPREGLPTKFPMAVNRRLLHGYHACVSYTDRNIGVLLDALESSGAVQNTIVVLWADHGWKLGDHSSWCKHTNFECDARVPLIVRFPGRNMAGSKTAALVELIDIYPTLCELAGVEAPTHLQGRSFAGVLTSPDVEHRICAYSSYPHTYQKRRVVGHSIRTQQHRFTQWWDAKTDEVVDEIATDLIADPGETRPAELAPKKLGEYRKLLRSRVLDARSAMKTN